MNYFSPEMKEADINRISMLGLAHIGDGVYELLTRTMLCLQGHQAVGELHKLTVSYVKAPAQALAMEKILPYQQSDFEGLFEALEGNPVTIRFLDPPLHEFVPTEEEDIKKLAMPRARLWKRSRSSSMV